MSLNRIVFLKFKRPIEEIGSRRVLVNWAKHLNFLWALQGFRISLFALIVTHLQLILGLALYFVSPLGMKSISNNGMGVVMKDAALRLNAVEHPIMMILMVVFITIGYSKHKKKLVSSPKFKMLAIFYTIALILMLSRIPWNDWF